MKPFKRYIFCLVARRSAFSHCFPLFLVMTCYYVVISCHMVFKFAYFVELWIDYQPAKFQRCILSLASFIDREKHNDDIIMTPFHVVGI